MTLITPEIAFLTAGLVSDNVVVIGEVIAGNLIEKETKLDIIQTFSSENAPFETVVLVRSSHTGGFGESLKGLKFCHPGYNHDERITRYVLEEFDWKNINIDCGNDTTLTEQKFRAMAELYGSSCRPGKWTEDSVLDAYLSTSFFFPKAIICMPKFQKVNIRLYANFVDLAVAAFDMMPH